MIRNQPKTIVIDDWCYQTLCFGRYKERDGHKGLTEIQRRVRSVMKKLNGDATAAAESIGVSRQVIQGHVAHIKAKGWSI